MEEPSPLQRVEEVGLKGLRAFQGRYRAPDPEPFTRQVGQKPPRPGSLARSEIHWFPVTRRSLLRAYHAWSLFLSMDYWAKCALRLAEKVVDPARHVAVISCGPPHQVHEAGHQVARRHGLPHLVDLRDPWSLQERVLEEKASPLYFVLERRQEKKVLSAAAMVISNTEAATAGLRSAYPAARCRFLTVRNGYDAEPEPNPPVRERFIIAYAGSLYYDRDPGPLFDAVNRLVSVEHLTPAELGMLFVGNVSQFDGLSLDQIARERGVAEFLTLVPRQPKPELTRLLAQASVLVSLPQDSHMAIPSKIYEYMSFHASLLVLAEEQSATWALLRDTPADVVPPGQPALLADALFRRYSDFRMGIIPRPLAGNPEMSREYQARILFDALADIAGDPRALGRAAPAKLP